MVCIKSRALGVKVDRRSQSQPAGLEQGARERTEVLVLQKCLWVDNVPPDPISDIVNLMNYIIFAHKKSGLYLKIITRFGDF